MAAMSTNDRLSSSTNRIRGPGPCGLSAGRVPPCIYVYGRPCRNHTMATHICDERCSFWCYPGATYVCKTSDNTHICDATCSLRSHNADATLVCPVSGRCFEQSVSMNPFQRLDRQSFTDTRTLPRWQPSSSKRRRKPIQRREPEFDSVVVHDFISLLLVSDTRAATKTEPPCKRRRRSTHKKNARRKVLHVSYDSQLWEYWISVIHTFWTFTHQKSTCHKVSLREFALGVLYLLQYGLVVDKREILPKDDVLYSALPPVTELAHYGIAKRGIRCGKNVLLRCIQSCSVDALPSISPYEARTTRTVCGESTVLMTM